MYTQKKQKNSIRFIPYFIASYIFSMSVSANFFINPLLQVTDPGCRRQRSSSKNLPEKKRRLKCSSSFPNSTEYGSDFSSNASGSFEDNGDDSL